jgi:prefoldin beta subunit
VQSFTDLKEGESVFKLVGPILVKTDISDAMSLVDSRLALIRGEMSKAEARIKALGVEEEAIKDKVVAMQKRAGAGAGARRS